MRMHNGEERLPCHSEPKGRFDPDRPHKKYERRKPMEIECLTPEFPQGARVYSSDQDQTLFESHGCFPINTMLATRYKALGRGTGLGIGNDGDPQYTITKGHEHAVAYSVGDAPDTAFANAGDMVARTLTARADGSPMIDRGPNIVTQKGK